MWLMYREKEMKEKGGFFSLKIIREEMLIQRRTDFILIVNIIFFYASTIFCVKTTVSGHSMIVMNFNTEVCLRGPIVWTHNNVLLYN